MSQTEVNLNMTIGAKGLKADSGFDNVLSPRAQGDIPIGQAVAKVIGLDKVVGLPQNSQVTITFSEDLVTANEIDITINGTALATETFTTDHLTTMNNIATAIQALAEVDTATVSGSNNREIVIVSELADDLVVNSVEVTLGATQATATNTYSTNQTPWGVALRTQAKENINTKTGTEGAAPYFDGECVNALTRGRVYVEVEQTVTSDDSVYVRFVENGSLLKGNFRADDASGEAVVWANARYNRGAEAGELAVLEINMP